MRGDQFFERIALQPPFTKLHPKVACFLKEYLRQEKVIPFGQQWVVNTNFPPFPSAAFDGLARQFGQLGDAATRRLYSVTVALTNRCHFLCWHCYNAGRSQEDLPLARVKTLASELQALGAIMVTLTGGEPLLREDLEQIVAAFDNRSCLILGTTGDGLTSRRARQLRAAGLFGVGISLDSDVEANHDRLRGRAGAFRAALAAVRAARDSGLYAYVVSVATREFLARSRFERFLQFVAGTGALEVHLLEPCATGRLAGRAEVILTAAERQQIFQYQREVAQRTDLPILSSFAYLESPEAFGCGAGLTHLYIDGSGEVCPCNLVPLSFGNLAREPLQPILERMGACFDRPRTACVGRLLARHFRSAGPPMALPASIELCDRHLPREHSLPAFFRVREEARGEVGAPELQAAYNEVHADYEWAWLSQAGRPVDELIQRLVWTGQERIFEAGCGTGYATAQLALRAAQLIAVDLSEGMLGHARERLRKQRSVNVRLTAGDALEHLRRTDGVDRVFSSWVLGYIPLRPFFEAARLALHSGGQLAFLVHRENSPREPLEIFAQLIAENPAALLRRVAFDFPRDAEHVRALVAEVGLKVEDVREGSMTFPCRSAEEVLGHLLRSGAGTAFYDAVDPGQRPALMERFKAILRERHRGGGPFDVCHEYVACIARKPQSAAGAD